MNQPDPTTDRIVDVLTPFFANFSDEAAARANAGEAAAALAAVLPGPADTDRRGRYAQALHRCGAQLDDAGSLADLDDIQQVHVLADAVIAVADAEQAAVRRATLLEAADRYAALVDQNEAYDAEHGTLDQEARLQHGAVRDVAIGLRRMADEQPPAAPAAEEQPESETPKPRRRCPHNDIGYGLCIRPALHDGECFHEAQPIRIDEETDEDSLCGAEYPGDDNFVGQLCGLPKEHFGEHRCEEGFAGTAYIASLRWPNGAAS